MRLTGTMRLFLLWLCLLHHIATIGAEQSPKQTNDQEKNPPPPPPAAPSPTMGQNIKSFGETVIKRIDRIVKKKTFSFLGDPWTVQGLPLAFPSPSSGFHLGVRLMLHNIKRQDPHKAEFEGQVLASDRGRYKHFLKLDIPRFLDGKFRFTTRIAYDRDITLPYFGIGNNTQLLPFAPSARDPLYQNDRTGPTITLRMLRRIGRNLEIGPIFGFRWISISTQQNTLLAQQRPTGINGGRTHYFGIAIIDQSLDFEPYPSRGRSHEIHMSLYSRLIGSDYTFFRMNYIYRKYQPLHRNLILSYRFLFESLTGDVPYYELGGIGGTRPTLSFGGDRYLRGYPQNQFIDRLRTVLGLELRWDPLRFVLARQNFTIGFVPFFDVGRVWDRVFPLSLHPVHASTGWGMRIIWNHRFVLRSDFAMTNQGTAIYFNFGNSF